MYHEIEVIVRLGPQIVFAGCTCAYGLNCILFDFECGLILAVTLVQLKEDSLWAEWTDVAFEKLDSNGDGYISLDEIMSTMPTSDSDDEANAHLVAVSQV